MIIPQLKQLPNTPNDGAKDNGSLSAGFSAVELLITLFVAAAFLVAGYQLFNAVISDGGDTRSESRASNIAYEYLRTFSDSATNPCSNLTPLVSASVTADGLSNATVSVTITCASSDTNTLSRVQADVTYNNPSKTVSQVTYIDKSKGASPVVELSDGLISQWKLNGNGNNDAGTVGLTNNNGASAVDGQNGQPNGAMSFNKANLQSMSAANYSQNLVGLGSFSITGWVKPPGSPATNGGFFGIRDASTPANAAYLMQIASSNNMECKMAANGTQYSAPNLALTANTWQFVSLVYSGTTLTCSVGNTYSSPVAASWSSFTNGSLPFEVGTVFGSSNNYNSTMSIDDVRVYNRALNSTEINLLASLGAK